MKNLTERDLLCIALHLCEFIEVHWKENKDAKPACEGCKLAHEGRCTESHLLVDAWPQFEKLFDLTGIKCTPWIKGKTTKEYDSFPKEWEEELCRIAEKRTKGE